MKTATIIVAAAIAAAAVFYFSQAGQPACDGNILAADNIVGCDIKGSTK